MATWLRQHGAPVLIAESTETTRHRWLSRALGPSRTEAVSDEDIRWAG
jgi:hypothetical protein